MKRTLQMPAGAALLAALAPLDGPWATFARQQEATVRWETQEVCPTVLEFAAPGTEWVERRDDAPVRSHAVTLTGLRRNTEYRYRLCTGPGPEATVSDEYTLDTEFDFSIPELPPDASPYPPDALTSRYERAAAEILKRSGIDRGYCLNYGCGDGRLGYEITRRSGLQVIGYSADRTAVERGRQRLLAVGVYGSRVTLQHVASLDRLPLVDGSVNLVISDEALATGRAPGQAAEVARKLRPCGGRAFMGGPGAVERFMAEWLRGLTAPEGVTSRTITAGGSGWAVLERPDALPGAGEWTHAYGTAGQTANSGDELVGGEAGKTLEVQWFGLPGPNAMLDRQVRMQGPLSAFGRVFVLGWDRVIALDAYNGAILWSAEIPDLRRTNIPRNCGNACANATSLFLAVRGACWEMDAATGERKRVFRTDEAGGPTDWGYVGQDGARLIGSAVRAGNMETEYAGWDRWFDAPSGPETFTVCSDTLFAEDLEHGGRLWTRAGGLVLNPTIGLGGGRVYFLESRNETVRNAEARRFGPELWADVHLVALDSATGEPVWERPYPIGTQPIVAYLVTHGEQVAISASYDGEYHVDCFAAATGEPVWQARHPWRSDNHGHHIQHPVIAQERLFLEPIVYDWATGVKLEVPFPSRNKCGTITGAANLLHYRDYNDEVWDLQTGTQSEFPGLRSNCWVGLISGNGLLLSPVSAGGCSCEWPIFCSMAYRTKDGY